jgi:hypothetical protein
VGVTGSKTWRVGKSIQNFSLKSLMEAEIKCRWEDNIKMGLKDTGYKVCSGFFWHRIASSCGVF